MTCPTCQGLGYFGTEPCGDCRACDRCPNCMYLCPQECNDCIECGWTAPSIYKQKQAEQTLQQGGPAEGSAPPFQNAIRAPSGPARAPLAAPESTLPMKKPKLGATKLSRPWQWRAKWLEQPSTAASDYLPRKGNLQPYRWKAVVGLPHTWANRTYCDDSTVRNREECWVACLRYNAWLAPDKKMTDADIVRHMQELFDHSQEAQKYFTLVACRTYRNKFNLGVLKGVPPPDVPSWRYMRYEESVYIVTNSKLAKPVERIWPTKARVDHKKGVVE